MIERVGHALCAFTYKGNWRYFIPLLLASNFVFLLRIGVVLGKLPNRLWLRLLLGMPIPWIFFIPILWLELKYIIRGTGHLLLFAHRNPLRVVAGFTFAFLAVWCAYIFIAILKEGDIVKSVRESPIVQIIRSLHKPPSYVWTIIAACGGLIYGADIIGRKKLRRIDKRLEARFDWGNVWAVAKQLILVDVSFGVTYMMGAMVLVVIAYWASPSIHDLLRDRLGQRALHLMSYWILVRIGLGTLIAITEVVAEGRSEKAFLWELIESRRKDRSWKTHAAWIKDVKSTTHNSVGSAKVIYLIQIALIIIIQIWDAPLILPLVIVSLGLGFPFYLLLFGPATAVASGVSISNIGKLKSPLRTIGGLLVVIGAVGAVVTR